MDKNVLYTFITNHFDAHKYVKSTLGLVTKSYMLDHILHTISNIKEKNIKDVHIINEPTGFIVNILFKNNVSSNFIFDFTQKLKQYKHIYDHKVI